MRINHILLARFFLILFFTKTSLSPLLSWALDYGEAIKATIVKISPNKKRIILDRGKEDGLNIRDMAVLSLQENFKIKVVCVVSDLEYSEWFIYSNTPFSKEIISVEKEIELKGIYGKNKLKIHNLAEIQANSFLHQLQEEYRKQEKVLQEKKREEEEQILYKKYTQSQYRNFHIPDMKVKFNLSPFSFKTPHRERVLSYGLDFKNDKERNNYFEGELKHKSYAFTNPLLRNEYSSSKTEFGLSLERKNEWKTFKPYHLVEFRREMMDSIYPIRHQIDLGPYGFKLNFDPIFIKGVADLSLIYIPLLEFYSGDKKATTKAKGSFYTQNQNTYLRHAFMANLSYLFLEDFQLKLKLRWRPAHTIKPLKIDFLDSDFSNNVTFQYSILPQFSLSYENTLSYDIRRRRNYDLTATELENAFFLHYQFELENISF